MAGPLDLRGRVTIADGASGPLRQIKAGLDAVGQAAQKISTGQYLRNLVGSAKHSAERTSRAVGGAVAATGAAAAGGVVMSFVHATREFNEAAWGAQAAFLGGVKGTSEADLTAGLRQSQEDAEKLRRTALDLSKALGLMPEAFMGAGEEAAKMGLDFDKSKAIMRSAGMVQMSDREAKANVIAKAIGSYGIIYGAEDDPAKYAKQAHSRASMLALAGAQTRTSASKIEEGMRNYMGMHGAFGGRFEDAVAIIAMGSQIGQMEKETGTSMRSLQGRFLNMPTGGRAALAGAGIDLSKFMDFGAVDPMRATNQLIQMFPQQLGKGARGKLLQFLEGERASGGLNDPSIINKTVQFLERQGLKFAGDQDRENAANKITSVMSGVGGKFDPLALISEIDKAIKEGRAGPNIWAAIGEPKRLHQYAGLMKVVNETLKLRNGLLEDGGRYLDLVARGYAVSDAGKIVALESAWRRLQITMMRSDGVQSMLGAFQRMADWVESLPPGVSNMAGSLLAFGAVASVVGFGLAGIALGVSALAGLFGALASTAGLVVAAIAAAAAGVYLLYSNWSTVIGSLSALLGPAWSAIASVWQSGVDGLRSTLDAFSTWIAGTWVGSVTAALAPQYAETWATIKATWQAGVDGLKATLESFSTWLSGTWVGSIVSAISGAVDRIGEAWGRLKGFVMPWARSVGPDSNLLEGPVRAPGSSSIPPVPSTPPPPAPRTQTSPDQTGQPVQAAASSAEAATTESVARIRATFQSLDLTAEGQRIMATLAAGITAGGQAAIQAAQSVADGVRNATSGVGSAPGVRVPLNTGPSMRGAH